MEPGLYDLNELSDSPLQNISDSWAQKGRCPVCGAPKALDINHIAEAPDQFVCQQCAAAFEMQSNGPQIRLKKMPDILKPVWNEVFDRWMAPADLHSLYQRHQQPKQQNSSQGEGESEDSPETSLSNQEVMYRAMELQKLGNNYKVIELLLLQAGATSEQVSAAINKLRSRVNRENKNRGRTLGLMGGAAVLLLIIIAGAIWIMSIIRPSVVEPNKVEERDSFLSDLLPINQATGFIGAPTPQVVRGGPEEAPCPTSASQAAKLFGGDAVSWRREGYNAWVMLRTGPPITIRVPVNMFAGILNIFSFR